jgi:hypothetical protein
MRSVTEASGADSARMHAALIRLYSVAAARGRELVEQEASAGREKAPSGLAAGDGAGVGVGTQSGTKGAYLSEQL